MNFDGNFRLLGTIDATEINAHVEELTEDDWRSASFRQQRYEVHKDTQTIGLVFDEDFRHSHPTRLPMLERFVPSLTPVLAAIADSYEGSADGKRLVEQFGYGFFVRATLVRLRGGGAIKQHTDNNFSLTHCHRIHIPLKTNNEVLFTVGKEVRSLAVGEVVEINNRRLHSVENRSDENRVHLILDFVLPGEKCCCGKRLHPDTLCSPVACRPTDQLEVDCNCFPEA